MMMAMIRFVACASIRLARCCFAKSMKLDMCSDALGIASGQRGGGRREAPGMRISLANSSADIWEFEMKMMQHIFETYSVLVRFTCSARDAVWSVMHLEPGQ